MSFGCIRDGIGLRICHPGPDVTFKVSRVFQLQKSKILGTMLAIFQSALSTNK
jgi:hypothetical protein